MFYEELTAEETKKLTKQNSIPPLVLGEYEIEIPGNGISQVGIDLIQQELYAVYRVEIPGTIVTPNGKVVLWKWDWMVRGKGEYVGALPKRISKYMWQKHEIKLSTEALTRLGNIGSQHSSVHTKYWFDIVTHIDWDREDFGQPADCCYWGCHRKAKDMILDNGGGVIRFFRNNTYHRKVGFARAWLAPWDNGCWIVFNGYGLETLAITRILTTHLGYTYYRQIALINHGSRDGTLWINNSPYIIGPQQSILRLTEVDLGWQEPFRYECYNCEEGLESNSYTSPDENVLCQSCFDEEYFICQHCMRTFRRQDITFGPDNIPLCPPCQREACFTCAGCNNLFWRSEQGGSSKGGDYCINCNKKPPEDQGKKSKKEKSPTQEGQEEIHRMSYSLLDHSLPVTFINIMYGDNS